MRPGCYYITHNPMAHSTTTASHSTHPVAWRSKRHHPMVVANSTRRCHATCTVKPRSSTDMHIDHGHRPTCTLTNKQSAKPNGMMWDQEHGCTDAGRLSRLNCTPTPNPATGHAIRQGNQISRPRGLRCYTIGHEPHTMTEATRLRVKFGGGSLFLSPLPPWLGHACHGALVVGVFQAWPLIAYSKQTTLNRPQGVLQISPGSGRNPLECANQKMD